MPNYRQLHEESLRQNKPDFYQELKRNGDLKAHLDSVQQDANSMHQLVVKQLAESNPFNPAEWKNSKPAWEGWIERTAEELVLDDRVLVRDAETEKAMRDGYVD